jgi:hypothetical protein
MRGKRGLTRAAPAASAGGPNGDQFLAQWIGAEVSVTGTHADQPFRREWLLRRLTQDDLLESGNDCEESVQSNLPLVDAVSICISRKPNAQASGSRAP